MNVTLRILLWYCVICISVGLICIISLEIGAKKFEMKALLQSFLCPFYIGYWLINELCFRGLFSKFLLYKIENVYIKYKVNKIKESMEEKNFRISSIDRHRIDTDGEGVTTLMVLNQCPLNCKFCLNPKARTLNNHYELISPKSLSRHLRVDDMYFRASNGGITFGGGEPLLQAEKIKELRNLCPPEWKFNIETSLNVNLSLIQDVADIIDHWMIDIKDMNPQIYKRYTGKSNSKVIDNLQWMVDHGMADKMEIFVPQIPYYNTLSDVRHSVKTLENMGLSNIKCFEYIIPQLLERQQPERGCIETQK